MDKKYLLLVVIILVIVGCVVGAVFFFSNNKVMSGGNNQTTDGIQVSLPSPNDTVSSPLKITGMVNGNGWAGFEGQVGTVRLLDDKGNQLALGILTATEDWMKLPTNFETALWFDYPSDGTGVLEFHNENASGEPSRDKTFILPVKLSKGSSERTKVKVYFQSLSLNPMNCSAVDFIEREVPKTQAIAKAALEELLKGPTALELHAGWGTAINAGVKIQSLIIENGIAKVDFSEELDKNVAGACRVVAIRSQIEHTLKQFSTVKNVQISVNGRIEDILQP